MRNTGGRKKMLRRRLAPTSKTVSRWERRVAYPSPYFRQKLSELFNKSLRELDLLSSVEKELGDSDTPISQSPAATFDAVENPPDEHIDDTSRPMAANVPSGQQIRPAALQQQNRKRMLGRLRHSYNELLEYSLQKLVWIKIGSCWDTQCRTKCHEPSGTSVSTRCSNASSRHLDPGGL